MRRGKHGGAGPGSPRSSSASSLRSPSSPSSRTPARPRLGRHSRVPRPGRARPMGLSIPRSSGMPTELAEGVSPERSASSPCAGVQGPPRRPAAGAAPAGTAPPPLPRRKCAGHRPANDQPCFVAPAGDSNLRPGRRFRLGGQERTTPQPLRCAQQHALAASPGRHLVGPLRSSATGTPPFSTPDATSGSTPLGNACVHQAVLAMVPSSERMRSLPYSGGYP
jgi:hypothetical protein